MFVQKQKLCIRWAGDCKYLPASDAIVSAVQCQLHIRKATVALPSCSLCAYPIFFSDIFMEQGAICRITECRDDKPVRIGGFFGSLWNNLQARLNFT